MFLRAVRSRSTKITFRDQNSLSSQLQRLAVNQIRQGHTVRVIITEDLPGGTAYAGEVKDVRAGYARNHLIPQKKALYATPQNFERVGFPDPHLVTETAEERRAREAREKDQDSEDVKAADFLRHYLRNKTLKIWRNVDSASSRPVAGTAGIPIHPGMVDHKVVREKLAKQLKIDLEDHEIVQLKAEAVPHGQFEEDKNLMEDMMENMPALEEGEQCQTQIRHLGDYLAKISLKGNQTVGLKVSVLKR